MSHKKNTEQIYRDIMKKVIEKIKDEFIFDGSPQETINLLKTVKYIFIYFQKWESKLIEKGIFDPKQTVIKYF